METALFSAVLFLPGLDFETGEATPRIWTFVADEVRGNLARRQYADSSDRVAFWHHKVRFRNVDSSGRSSVG